MPSYCDLQYQNIVADLHFLGTFLETRNSPVKSLIAYDPILFVGTPLVTWRKTAWKKALREMEWFLSGDPKCPTELLDWWDSQLGPENNYFSGYGQQLRHYSTHLAFNGFDQIKSLLYGIRQHQGSRRLITTTWNPAEMVEVTKLNDNSRTPTTCHGTLNQYFVRHNALHLTTYQRSADILLGVPHNWIQYWALLLYLAHWTHLEVGSLRWLFGDLHLYQHETHIDAAQQIINARRNSDEEGSNPSRPTLVYTPSVEWKTGSVEWKTGIPEFKAADFTMEGVIPGPLVTVRPQLL